MKNNRRIGLKKALSVALALSMTTGTTFSNVGMVSYADVQKVENESVNGDAEKNTGDSEINDAENSDNVTEEREEESNDTSSNEDTEKVSEEAGDSEESKEKAGDEDDSDSATTAKDNESSDTNKKEENTTETSADENTEETSKDTSEDTESSADAENNSETEKSTDSANTDVTETSEASDADKQETEAVVNEEDTTTKTEALETEAETTLLGSLKVNNNTSSNQDEETSALDEQIEEVKDAKESAEKKYHNDEGSTDIETIKVPELAVDEDSVSFVWEKPENYAEIADYKVYLGEFTDGECLGTASENYAKYADWAEEYRKAFYKKHSDAVKINIHSFYVDGLDPDTDYTFTVVPVDENGDELGAAQSVEIHTSEKLTDDQIHYVTDYGAKAVDEVYTTYDDAINEEIEENTKAIQAAIDACGEGEKVVIPEGIFMSGALYLHSNMTLELEEGAVLEGSPNVDHYDQNYILYPYSTDTRSWSLVNVYSADEDHPYENIRIVGKGTIDGNGWKSIDKDSKHGEDPSDDDYISPQYFAGKNSNVLTGGILAEDATRKAAEERGEDLSDGTAPSKLAYNTRPSLVMIRGTKNFYIEGVTLSNPAYHTLAVLDSDTVTSNNVKYLTYDCNNGDGIEIGNTQNAMIYNSFFDTGDDAVNFATGMGKAVADTNQQSSSYIWTFDNVFRECHGGAIAAGSHTGAGISDMLVEDNVLNYSDMPFRFKSAPANGGSIHDVLIRDCAVANCDQLFVMTTTYSDSNGVSDTETADTPAEFYNIDAYNITCEGTNKNAFSLIADVDPSDPSKPVHRHHDLYFQDITVTKSANYKSNSSISKVYGDVLDGIEDATFYNVNITHKDGGDVWNEIINCKGLHFYDSTESSQTKNAETIPVWTEDTELDIASSSELKVASGSELSLATASEISVVSDSVKKLDTADYSLTIAFNKAEDKDLDGDEQSVKYNVETYIAGDEKPVDVGAIFDDNSTESSNKVTKTLKNLCAGVEYLFKVYAYDATGNKTEGPGLYYTIDGDSAELIKPDSLAVEDTSAEVYTSVPVTVADARKADGRIRGYRTYVDGQLNETYYYYELGSKKFSGDNVTVIVDRLTDGETDEETNRKTNTVKVVAFADDGQEFEYDEAVATTWQMYDYKAPVWNNNDVDVTRDGDDLVLSWDEAEDESGIVGYRVYVDGKAVYDGNGEYFNHVNGAYTTADTTFTVSGLDLDENHIFTVTAGDNWWRAQKYEAPYHWTNDVAEGVWTVSHDTKPEETDKHDETPSQDKKKDNTVDEVKEENNTEETDKNTETAVKATSKTRVSKVSGISGSSKSSSSGSGYSSSGKVLGESRVNASTMGFWTRDNTGWKFRSINGETASNCWKECEYNGTTKWYHFDGNGYIMSGWYVDGDNNLYYLSDAHDGSFGQMLTGWHTINGKEYYFEADSAKKLGRIYVNEMTPDGHFVGADCAKIR